MEDYYVAIFTAIKDNMLEWKFFSTEEEARNFVGKKHKPHLISIAPLLIVRWGEEKKECFIVYRFAEAGSSLKVLRLVKELKHLL